jgi:phage-related protein
LTAKVAVDLNGGGGRGAIHTLCVALSADGGYRARFWLTPRDIFQIDFTCATAGGAFILASVLFLLFTGRRKNCRRR